MKNFLRYSFKALKIFVLVIAILYLAAYIYVSINKKKILADISEGISNSIDGDVTIKAADISFFRSFPRIAVNVQDISVTDSMFSVHKHPFFKAENVFININIFKAIMKQPSLKGITIKKGAVFFYTDTSGYSNAYLLNKKKEPTGGPKKSTKDFAITDLRLQEFNFTLLDEKREKYHDINVKYFKADLSEDKDFLYIEADANMFVKSLAFNVPNGTFLKNTKFESDFKLSYGKQSQTLKFDSIDVDLNDHPYNLSGSFDLGDKNPGFDLAVHVKNAWYEEVKKLLPTRIATSLAMVSLDKTINANAILKGPLKGGEPSIYVDWDVKGTKLKTIFMDFDNASFTGYYSNEVVKGLPRRDPNSEIKIKNFTAEWHGLPVSNGDIEILNLQTPQLTAKLTSDFPLKSLNELLQTSTLKLTEGDAAVTLAYKGPVARNTTTNSFLDGSVVIKKGKMLYAPRGVTLNDVSGIVLFRNSNVTIENLQCDILGNKIKMNGIANNLLTLMSTQANKVNIKYNIYSPSLNLASFLYLLKSPEKTSTTASNANFSTVSKQIDAVLQQSTIDVDLIADRVIYKKLDASNLKANITVLQDRYLLNNVSMALAGGSMAINGSLVNNSSKSHLASLNTKMTNVDIKRVLYAFENFGQDGVTSQNLAGNFTADAAVSIGINNEGAVVPASANGTVNFSLKNGELNNFEPLQKIQNVVFKKRDFDNIRFAELKNKFLIRNGEVTINRMQIQSSVITLFVEGLYSQRGKTDISVQVPLNNLKTRDENYVPENLAKGEKAGRSVYLRGQPGKDGNINFKLDLLDKYHKEKQ